MSACPRNCAESGIKDLGVVGIDGGWELYVGGNGGTHLRAGDLLMKVKTNEEVLEYAGLTFSTTEKRQTIWSGHPHGLSASVYLMSNPY
ncbi:hypothetical protein QNN00_01725 [Bacillus velezensis]|nr:hypothetical protein [Bacillus velezensis]